MLQRIQVSNPNYILDKMSEDIVPGHEQWIVRHANEVKRLQNEVRTKKNFLVTNTIIGWSHFINEIFQRQFPNKKVVHESFVKKILNQFLTKNKNKLGLTNWNINRIWTDFLEWHCILKDNDFSNQDLEEWISTQAERQSVLKESMLISRLVMGYLNDNHLVTSEMILTELINTDWNFEIKWPEKLNLYLGPQNDSQEIELIKIVAKQTDVNVFYSQLWGDSESWNFGYSVFDVNTKIDIPDDRQPRHQVFHFTSRLGEVRWLVEEIKMLFESGIRLDQIGIYAINNEEFSEIFYWLLRAEFPDHIFEKKIKIQEFPKVQDFLDVLNVFSDELSASLVQKIAWQCGSHFIPSDFLSHKELVQILLELNYPILSRVLSTFERWVEIKNQFFTIHDFINLTEPIWDHFFETDAIETLLDKLLSHVSSEQTLSIQDWIMIIFDVSRQVRSILISNSEADSLTIERVQGATGLGKEYIFLIGLDSEISKGSESCIFSLKEHESLRSTLGHKVTIDKRILNEIHLKNLTAGSFHTIFLSYSSHSLDGKPISASGIWQEAAIRANSEIKTSGNQTLLWDKFLLSNVEYVDRHQEAVNWKLKEKGVSASSLKTFYDCPAQFYYSRLLNLDRKDAEGFSLSARDEGTWAHDLLSQIVDCESVWLKWAQNNEQEKIQIWLSDLIDKNAPPKFSQKAWETIRVKHLEDLKDFIRSELAIKKIFPNMKTWKTEWSWQAYFNLQTKTWSPHSTSSEDYKLKGDIDRILVDESSNRYWIIDYKSSLSSYPSYLKWIEKGYFQLLFYYKGLKINLPSQVIISYLGFWEIPDAKKKRGLIISGTIEKEKYMMLGHKKTDFIDVEQWASVEQQFDDFLSEKISAMEKSYFQPTPLKDDVCNRCQWRTTCRAPHL